MNEKLVSLVLVGTLDKVEFYYFNSTSDSVLVELSRLIWETTEKETYFYQTV